jgi:hypothetical protein
MIEVPGLLVLGEAGSEVTVVVGWDGDGDEVGVSGLYLVDRVRCHDQGGERRGNVRVSHVIKQGEGWCLTARNMDDEDVVFVLE